MALGRHARQFVDNMAESTAACLVTMVQGNLLALTLGHWLVASQTGLAAGAATSLAILAARVQRPWVVSTLLGLTTFVVDSFIHPGGFGPVFMEALVTGAGAAVLSYGVQWGIGWLRARRSA